MVVKPPELPQNPTGPGISPWEWEAYGHTLTDINVISVWKHVHVCKYIYIDPWIFTYHMPKMWIASCMSMIFIGYTFNIHDIRVRKMKVWRISTRHIVFSASGDEVQREKSVRSSKKRGPRGRVADVIGLEVVYYYESGWWFGTFIFFHILGIIIPID